MKLSERLQSINSLGGISIELINEIHVLEAKAYWYTVYKEQLIKSEQLCQEYASKANNWDFLNSCRIIHT